MFSFYAVAENPVTKEPALWFYSPRCSLSCRNCVLPFRTSSQYIKLDFLSKIREHRRDISSVVFYLGDMQQKANVVQRYLALARARFEGLGRYICFSAVSISALWKYLSDSLIDGLVFYLQWPLTLPAKSSYRAPFMAATGCNERYFLQTLFVFHALTTDPLAPPHKIIPVYNPSSLRSSVELSWHNKYFS